jgi:5'-nucleotidase
MPYPIQAKLVIAVASSALFDLSESDGVYRERGVEEYRRYQRENENNTLSPGVAFPLIRRILELNSRDETDRPIEVILLSRNDPDTGSRVFRSIQQHGLDITRAAFVSGGDPLRYLDAFNAALFLSANENDVRNAVQNKQPAGRVFPANFVDDSPEDELRIAFDFDGVIADDSAETIHKAKGLAEFQRAEQERAAEPLPVGPLYRLFSEIARLQKRERERKKQDPSYKPRIRLAIVTARNAPAHERVVSSLRQWEIEVDEVFFLGGIDKARILEVFKPHIFFDDQVSHIEAAARVAPSAHVPFGVTNQPTPN